MGLGLGNGGGIERKIEFSVEEASARTGSAGGNSADAVAVAGGWGRDLERDGVGEVDGNGREVRDRRGV